MESLTHIMAKLADRKRGDNLLRNVDAPPCEPVDLRRLPGYACRKMEHLGSRAFSSKMCAVSSLESTLKTSCNQLPSLKGGAL